MSAAVGLHCVTVPMHRLGGSGTHGRSRSQMTGRDSRSTAPPSVGPSYRDVLELWPSDEAFRDRFTKALADSEHPAFFWETPPISAVTVARPFEFVLVNSTALARARPGPAPFESQIGDGRGTHAVRTFSNLGGDAVLVVPCEAGPPECYTFLSAAATSCSGSALTDPVGISTNTGMHVTAHIRP